MKWQRVLNARVHVHRAFRLQLTVSAVKPVHLTEVGELAIHAASAAKPRPLRKTEFGVHPRRSGCGAREGPAVYTDARRDRQSRPHAEPDLPVRRGGACVLIELIQADSTARRRELERNRVLAIQPLSIAAEFQDQTI